ncbi:hypothetical protein PMIN06_005867 [Paraphaeosphaeria minitans]|uniref:Uncharacterized protein n=1 Tax=Paraphaeosphaeria minitans TaxID=565426 RepID=A0A9P6G6H3_9PLEO|nr:hypothetical protein PMIN01_12282 [Paraphaeosphaeria minitans]
MSVQVKAKLRDAHSRESHPGTPKEVQIRFETQLSRSALRPAPLKLEGTGFDEQPRIGPLPPTPLNPTVGKRKAAPMLFESNKPYCLPKKRGAIKQRSPPTQVATGVGANRRIGVNDLAITMNDQGANMVDEVPFPFLELPGEIRNMIYRYCADMSKRQALVVYLPKTGTLRSSTRQVRAAPGKYHELDNPDKKKRGRKGTYEEAAPTQIAPKDSNRPFVGLTQVCLQIRKEFYPMYIANQEIGMDLTNTSKYMQTFFNPNVPLLYADALDPSNKNMPFRGNITIAVAGKILPIEKTVGWIDALPLLNTWANSAHIEAGFGRYSRIDYRPQVDGEAKDLYRLYGRKVLPDRSCTEMNKLWRTILRQRKLAAVRIHRGPGGHVKPHFHLIWKHAHRESWMTGKHSVIPGTVDGRATVGSWLWNLGFDEMEHFEVRVGAEQRPGEFLFIN